METKFNFKSAICTSREQSEKLLALGLKKETADMYYRFYDKNTYEINPTWETIWQDRAEYKNIIPAWSLDRLMKLIPENIFTGVRNQWYRVMYNSILTYEKGGDSLVIFGEANIYDRCISCIEWLIKEGCFNKEYLV